MSTLSDPLNSTTNPFITGGGGGGGPASQKHYQELTFSGISQGNLSFSYMRAYSMRPSFPTMYKNFTGVTKFCRKGTIGFSGPTGDFSIFQIYKNGTLAEQIQPPTWTSVNTTASFTLTNTFAIFDGEEIEIVHASGTSTGEASQYISLILEWDGDIP